MGTPHCVNSPTPRLPRCCINVVVLPPDTPTHADGDVIDLLRGTAVLPLLAPLLGPQGRARRLQRSSQLWARAAGSHIASTVEGVAILALPAHALHGAHAGRMGGGAPVVLVVRMHSRVGTHSTHSVHAVLGAQRRLPCGCNCSCCVHRLAACMQCSLLLLLVAELLLLLILLLHLWVQGLRPCLKPCSAQMPWLTRDVIQGKDAAAPAQACTFTRVGALLGCAAKDNTERTPVGNQCPTFHCNAALTRLAAGVQQMLWSMAASRHVPCPSRCLLRIPSR